MSADRYRLYSETDLASVIDDMARQAVVLLDATPTVVLGERLLARMRVHAPWADIARLDLMVKRYADNLELLHPDTALEAPDDCQLAGRRVIVVDDVLYQGYSLARVFEWLATQKPAQVHAAVLVDRQRHRLPMRADIVGVTLKIAPGDVIECNVPPYEAEFAVDLWRPGAV